MMLSSLSIITFDPAFGDAMKEMKRQSHVRG
jgi:hypothetical protein